MKMMDKTQSKVAIYAIVMLIIAILLFIKFEDNNTYIYYFAGFLLTSSIVLFIWIESFSTIESFKLSIILTVITVCIVILSMYIGNNFKILQMNYSSAIIGIIMSQIIPIILNKNLKSIEKIFDKYF